MPDEERLEELLERHKAFWRREDTDGPLMMEVRPYAHPGSQIDIPLADGTMAGEGTELTPENIDPRRMMEGYDTSLPVIYGDILRRFAPPDLCWTEALMECRIYLRGGCRWSAPFSVDWGDLESLKLRPENRWFKRLLEFTRLLVERAEGGFPVGEPLMRGPIDMLRAILGDNQMGLAFYDRPAEVRRLLEICTDAAIEALEAQFALIPEFHGGYVSHFGIWAPGSVGYSQHDASVQLSPQAFRERLLPHYERLVNSFDYPVIHTHSGALHHVDALLELEGLKAMQVSIDPPPFGPTVEEMIPTLLKIQETKPLIISSGPVIAEEREELLKTLSPKGLCFGVTVWQESENLYTFLEEPDRHLYGTWL